MGLFSSKKTYVSSTLYNMAGPIEDRPNFLKTLVIRNALSTSTSSLPKVMREAYTSGPGTRLRGFARWAKNNYKVVGVSYGNLYSHPQVDAALVAGQIPHDPNQSVSVERIEVQLGDYAFWAEQWMLKHEPTRIAEEWVSDYNETTNTITIKFPDGGSVSFVPTDFRKSSGYIYAVYSLLTGSESDNIVTGSNQIGPFPSTDGWTQVKSVTRTEPVQLLKIVEETASFSDGRPDEKKNSSSLTDSSYEYHESVYTKTVYNGSNPSLVEQISGVKSTLYMKQTARVEDQVNTTTRTETVDANVTKTIVTKTTEKVLVIEKTHQIDTQEIAYQTRSSPQMFIYRLGSGNSKLDKTVTQKSDDGFYFPFIPLRLDNKMLDTLNPTAYDLSEKAYKRATSGKLAEIMDELKGHKNLNDMDYVYVMFGVSLNTKENTGKLYLFDFFERVRLSTSNAGSYSAWATKQDAFDSNLADLNDWRQDQYDPTNPGFGDAAPSLSPLGSAPVNEIRIRGNGTLSTNMDVQIKWNSITKTGGTGLGRPNAKKGDCWIDNGTTDAYAQSLIVNGQRLPVANLKANRIVIHKQVTANSWEAITIIGLTHKNFIYKGKYVEIGADDALKDAEESGFLVPLHYETFRSMSLVDSTQLASACCYMVINSYVVKKTGFFQSTFFKILLVVVVIAITVATGGTGAGSIGLLGANAAVGAAIGLTGTLAIIAGAVANTLVALIVTSIINAGAVALFGEKLGAIIGAIASIVTLQVGTSLLNNVSLSSTLGALMKADSLIGITSSVGNGIAGYIQAGAMETLQKTEKLQEQYNQDSLLLNQKFEEQFGYGRALLDPVFMSNRDQFVYESRDTFLERTLMTGSDVAELTHRLLSNFTDMTLSTELPK